MKVTQQWCTFVALCILVAIYVLCWPQIKSIFDIYHCESFWKEQCTMVAVPSSIQPSFSKEYYDSVKNDMNTLK